MSHNNVLITGANRGIGLAFTQQYLQEGASVYAVCRHASASLKAADANIIEGVDVTDASSLNTLKTALNGIKLDILINNAGVLSRDSLDDIDFDHVENQMQVNAIAPVRVTQILQNNLSSGAKVALITSRMGSIADNGSGAFYGYRMSKAALNAAGKSLAIDLKPKGIAVAVLHPGFVQTDMVNHAGDISAETAAQRLRARIASLTIENSGTFWHSDGSVLPW